MPLEDLLQCIVNSESEDWLRRHLERLEVELLQPYTDVGEVLPVEELLDKLRELCCERAPYWVIREICSKDGLVSILRDRSCSIGNEISRSDLVVQVLDAFGIPFPKADLVLGPEGIRDRLIGLRKKIEKHLRQLLGAGTRRRGPDDMLRGLNISCWSYVEKFLKQVLGFYALHFERLSSDVAEELRIAFTQVSKIKHKALGRVLEAFREVEFIFNEGESRRQRKERERRLKKEVDKANGAQSVVERARLEDQAAREKAQQLSRYLQQECKDAFGRRSPFALLQLGDIHRIKRYRNLYAHETIEDLIKADPTGKKAKESVESALNLVNDFIEIAPCLVFLVAEASDAYGRRVILYLEEDQLVDEDPLLAHAGYFYHATFPFQPFAACFLGKKGGVVGKHEPPVYGYEDVESAVAGRWPSETG